MSECLWLNQQTVERREEAGRAEKKNQKRQSRSIHQLQPVLYSFFLGRLFSFLLLVPFDTDLPFH